MPQRKKAASRLLRARRPGGQGPLSDQVAQRLRDALVAGELAPGTPLREVALAKGLRVSRIPLREALRRLEAEGLVTFASYRGAVVAAPSEAELAELDDLRAELACRLVRRALPSVGKQHLEAAEGNLEALESSREPLDWMRAHWACQESLFAAADQPRLSRMLRDLQHATASLLRERISRPRERAGLARGDRKLLAACRARDARTAVSLLAPVRRDGGSSGRRASR